MELYKIYKQIKQRSSRHPYDKNKMEMAIIANDIFKGIPIKASLPKNLQGLTRKI